LRVDVKQGRTGKESGPLYNNGVEFNSVLSLIARCRKSKKPAPFTGRGARKSMPFLNEVGGVPQ